MEKGQSATIEFTVTDQDTASAVGSGDLPVLGTPRLLAWAEAATCAAIKDSIADGQTSVGSRVQLDHGETGRRTARGDRNPQTGSEMSPVK